MRAIGIIWRRSLVAERRPLYRLGLENQVIQKDVCRSTWGYGLLVNEQSKSLEVVHLSIEAQRSLSYSGSSSARSAHPSGGISTTYQVPASASLVGKLPTTGNSSGSAVASSLKSPAAIAQVPVPLQVSSFSNFRAIRGSFFLQKSGSQISHAPTEPVIKEDEDESSESSAGGANGVATITHLPIIGGAPLAQVGQVMPVAF